MADIENPILPEDDLNEESIAYMDSVKSAFEDNVEKYNGFLNMIQDFEAQRIDIRRLLMKIKVLFKDHPQLIVGFDTFLLNKYKIRIGKDENSWNHEFGDVSKFIKKVKDQFPNDIDVHISLLKILNEYQDHKKSIDKVHQEVSILFRDKQELIEEFKLLYPHSPKTTSEDVHKSKLNEWTVFSYLCSLLARIFTCGYWKPWDGD